MYYLLLTTLILFNKMKKWLKIITSLILTAGIVLMGIVNFNTMQEYGATHIMFWLAIWGFLYFLVFPALTRWWNFWNRILWNIQPDNLSRTEVRILFKEFIRDVGESRVTNHKQFMEWLKKKDLD